MDQTKPIAALFDLDGVIFDTEPQYSILWRRLGQQYLPEIPHLENIIKGQTLVQIFDKYFAGKTDVQREIAQALVDYEATMQYNYVPGVEDFIDELHRQGVCTAVVTSSNAAKMACVHRAHPDFEQKFDRILVAEMFAHSKPHPDCYLLGAKVFNVPITNCVVFEDSFSGLKAGRNAEMAVVGLSTTNPADAIAPYADFVMPDFSKFSYQTMLSLLQQAH